MGHSIRELKALLAARGVDFSHCCEREDLQQLLQEVEGQAAASSAPARAEQAAGRGFAGSAPAPAEQAGQPQGAAETAAPQPDPVRGLSVRKLKEALGSLGVDFSHCREKAELQELLRGALQEAPHGQDALFPDGSLAKRRSDGRLCWVEFVTDGDALCHWDDGTDAIVPASELDLLSGGTPPGPTAFDGSFEEARAEAFRRGGLLVAAVQDSDCAQSGSSKAEGLQTLVLASEEVALLLTDNAVFWRGRAQSLRAPHLVQLAPHGTPSLAMVLPLAVDAMKVLSHSPGHDREAVVEGFVSALEALESHNSMAEARLASEAAQLRQEQDAEFAASLAADQQLEQARRASLETAATEAASSPAEASSAEPSAAQAEAAGMDAGAKRPALGEDDREQQERLAKARRLLADEFLEQPTPPPGASVARLVLRLPTGERVQRTFAAEEPLSQVRRWAECCALLPEASGRSLSIPEHFDLATAFPQRTFGLEESEKTLAELGLAPSAALLLIDRTA